MKESSEDLKKILSPEAYTVTQEKGTEQAYTGKYYKHTEKGMYACVVCGAELFSSDTKFDSDTGWPSFHSPTSDAAVSTEEDTSHDMKRVEVTCPKCGAHLGHVFPDGPKEMPDGSPASGQRYCINSCALDFTESGTKE